MAGRLYTSPHVAGVMVKVLSNYVDVTKSHVLEPSAGSGRLVAALARAGVRKVTAVERERSAYDKLAALSKDRIRFGPVFDDFVNPWSYASVESWCRSRYDAVLANPPYEEEADVLHTREMMRYAGVVVGLYRVNVLHNVSFHKMLELAGFGVDSVTMLIGRPVFDGPDDKGHGGRHEYAIVAMLRAEKCSKIPGLFFARSKPSREKKAA